MININFASRNYRMIERVQSALIAGSAVLVAIMAMMLWTTMTLRADVTVMDRKIQNLEAVNAQAQPDILEREQLVKDLTSMSGLRESRKISWTKLLTNIEAVVPVGVALKHVDLNPKDSTLTMNGIARSPESLRNLVVAMEKAAPFKSPSLKHQSLEKGSISFNVVAVYREDKSPVVARRKQ
jgi:Tfp pilus assembly protein PilN